MEKLGVILKEVVIVVDTYNNHVENILIDKSSSDISPSGFFQSTDNKLWMILMESPMSFVVI